MSMTAKQSHAVITGKIKSLKKSANNMADVARSTAWLIIDHALQHGDVSNAGRLIDAYPTGAKSLRVFFRESGMSLSVKDDRTHASINDKKQGITRFPADQFDPLNFQTPETIKKKEQQSATRKANKAKRDLEESQKAEELAKQLDKANKANSLEAENKALKAENKALKAEVKALKAELAKYQQAIAA